MPPAPYDLEMRLRSGELAGRFLWLRGSLILNYFEPPELIFEIL